MYDQRWESGISAPCFPNTYCEHRIDCGSADMQSDTEQIYFISCGLLKKNFERGYSDMQLRNNISLKICGDAVAEFPSSINEIAIADTKKSCEYSPLSMKKNYMYLQED